MIQHAPNCESAHQFVLRVDDAQELRNYLIRRGQAKHGETLMAARAGEGNMNCVVRVRLSNRSLILKQARPWVEKYPSISAPVERAASEARFYAVAAKNPLLARMMPELLDYDEDSALLILEDLAPASNLADCYEGAAFLETSQLQELARYTSSLHQMAIPFHERESFRNEAMRKLNHEHIFDVPLRTDGAWSEMLERITPGLDGVGESFRHDREFGETVKTLGLRYLENEGASLIHGDLFPGSLLRTGTGALRVIDPEFCFCGDPEFDIGVFYAHLLLSCQVDDTASFWLRVALEDTPHSKSLVLQYAGVEIMRRILGVAQLPVSLSLEAKRDLLERSRGFVLAG
jgi:5-methylthioribose kinase